jgi:hypothetical protein
MGSAIQNEDNLLLLNHQINLELLDLDVKN